MKNRSKVRHGLVDNLFHTLNMLIMVIVILITLIPFLNVASKAVSGGGAVSAGLVSIFPVDFQRETVKYIMRDSQFQRAMENTVFITALGTAGGMILTILTAYPLSKEHLRGRKGFMYIYIFIMLFSGGMVPNFLLIQKLGFYDTIWAVTVPGAVSVFYMIILRTNFEQIPDALEEAAIIDGMNDLQILFRIFIPLSLPIYAALILFFAVWHWNSFFDAFIYLQTKSRYPLQVILKEIVTANTLNDLGNSAVGQSAMETTELVGENLKCATIIVVMLPVRMVYPFVQKYFVKGMMIGAVKG